jgi:hypothetical protein
MTKQPALLIFVHSALILLLGGRVVMFVLAELNHLTVLNP